VWLLALLFAGGCATVPSEYREPPPLAATEQRAFNLRVFDRAWELVNERYFDAAFRGVDWRQMRERYRPEAAAAKDTGELYVVVNRMCAELKESHLTALAPRRVHELRTDHRPGIGIQWRLVEGKRVVIDVVPASPAERAGIQRGWLVVARNGAPIREGERFIPRVGEVISFGFLDQQNVERTFRLQAELLRFERREGRRLENGALLLRFDRFDAPSLSWLSEQLKAHADAPAVVIDLRQNAGGNTLVLDMAVAEFFPDRVPLGRLVRRGGRTRENHSFAWRAARYGGEVVLLTGPATASAAEIFSHVLQHHRRATVVGQKTAGAVIYSRPYRLPEGGRLQIPIIDYVGLDGQRLEGRGVMPDVLVPAATLADARADRAPELQRALELLQRNE
jgi:carboxyl-terminal processing protease